MTLGFEAFTGSLDTTIIEAVANLRISVFRAWPYLYDGSMDYERAYLAKLASSPSSTIVVAKNGSQVVGAATGMKLADEHDEFKRPFESQGIDVSTIFYCAESVLDPAYRGNGAGHKFFDMREAHGRRIGAKQSTFCAVQRPNNHPLNPGKTEYLHDFWRKRGYQPVDGLTTTYAWKDIGENHETDKLMQFWMKEL
jgi:GNAT superfamily N-acetyltransferase